MLSNHLTAAICDFADCLRQALSSPYDRGTPIIEPIPGTLMPGEIEDATDTDTAATDSNTTDTSATDSDATDSDGTDTDTDSDATEDDETPSPSDRIKVFAGDVPDEADVAAPCIEIRAFSGQWSITGSNITHAVELELICTVSDEEQAGLAMLAMIDDICLALHRIPALHVPARPRPYFRIAPGWSWQAIETDSQTTAVVRFEVTLQTFPNFQPMPTGGSIYV